LGFALLGVLCSLLASDGCLRLKALCIGLSLLHAFICLAVGLVTHLSLCIKEVRSEFFSTT